MLGPREIEMLRRMTPAERWTMTAELMESAWSALCLHSFAEREKRLAVARLRHDETNEALVRALARALTDSPA